MTRGEVASTNKSILGESGINRGKLGPSFFSQGPAAQPPTCPECASQKVWKDGLRYTKNGNVQRFLCRSCGYRFSQSNVKVDIASEFGKTPRSRKNVGNLGVTGLNFSFKEKLNGFSLDNGENVSSHGESATITRIAKPLKALPCYNSKCRVCVSESEAKNLSQQRTRRKRAAGATAKTNRNIGLIKEFPKSLQSKIIEYAVKRINQGCTEQGVKSYLYNLRILKRNGANLHDPENVKAVVSRMSVSNRTKKNLVTTYDSFLKFLGGTWQKPKYVYSQKLPFIPLESEIDQLIAGCSKTISTVLQTLKETGARIGEVARIKWEDIDFKRNIVSINYPEKGSNPRQVKVSSKLIERLNRLPRRRITVFARKDQLSKEFYRQRKRIAHRINNPRLLSIGLHTIRHWHATMEFHRTKNLLHVQQRLGHKNIKNTLIYTHLISFEGDEYHSATAETVEEACKLVDAGFEYVCEINSVQVFRKRK